MDIMAAWVDLAEHKAPAVKVQAKVDIEQLMVVHLVAVAVVLVPATVVVLVAAAQLELSGELVEHIQLVPEMQRPDLLHRHTCQKVDTPSQLVQVAAVQQPVLLQDPAEPAAVLLLTLSLPQVVVVVDLVDLLLPVAAVVVVVAVLM
jgi:hypothetical protein